jgi:uncharacterized membrane protein
MGDRTVTFGLADGLIATRTGTGTYDAAIDVPHIQMMNATVRVLSAEGTGDDRIVALASRIIAGTVQMRMQAVPFNVLEIILGTDIYAVGADDTLVETIPLMAGTRLPWFGVVGQGLEEEGLGDVMMFAPKCKVASDISLGTMEYGTLSLVEFTATCLGEDDYPVLALQQRATIGEFDIPLASIQA